MLASTKLDVLWSPVHHDKFVSWGSDITLFEVGPIAEFENRSSHIKISPSLGASAVASQSGSGIRCLDISYIPDHKQPLLAYGHTSGRVTLGCLGPSEDAMEFVGREFGPRHPRLCNSVSWSPTETQLLAVALDKHRTEHSLVLWDITRGYAATVATESESPSSSMTSSPVAEMCLSETVHSVSWSNLSRTLISANNCKNIKLFDCRDLSNKAVSVTTSRYCYSPVADPFSAWRLASRGDSVLVMWDVRRFERPLLSLHHPHHLADVQWCPTRRNIIYALQRDSSTLRLHEIQQAHTPSPARDKDDNTSNNVGGSVVGAGGGVGGVGGVGGGSVGGGGWRDVSPCGGAGCVAASWHHHHPMRLLALNHAGVPCDFTVLERLCVSWGAGGVAWGAGEVRTLPEPPGTLAATMRARAKLHYGLKPELWQNAELAEDEVVANLWHFLSLSKSLVEDGCISASGAWGRGGVGVGVGGGGGGGGAGVPGVAGVLLGAGYRSEAVPALVGELPDVTVTLYRSAERSRALQLCGWGWGWEQGGAGVGGEAHCPRAAALAAFHLRLAAARDALAPRAPRPAAPAPAFPTPSPTPTPSPSTAATSTASEHALAALALPPHPNSRFWRETVSAVIGAVSEPYIRAMLLFLSALGHPEHEMCAVLNETGMRLEDRVAFACIYLPDSALRHYLQSTMEQLVSKGDLAGILLTGMSEAGVRLLQKWVDTTGDVQTAALLAARCLPAPAPPAPAPVPPAPAPPTSPAAPAPTHNALAHAPLLWKDTYRSLLNSWKLWWARCAFDSVDPDAPDKLPQVCVSCSYCGKSISGGRAPRLPPTQAKMKQVSCCPHCRKPLARCALCLGTLGVGAMGAPWGQWAAWCTVCRHGGHTTHLHAWFLEHSECPVSSCNCRCNALDPPDRP